MNIGHVEPLHFCLVKTMIAVPHHFFHMSHFLIKAPRTASGSLTFGKHDTQFGEWPHMCAVLREIELGATEKVLTYICGASLIAPHIILTAAHCVQ